jgi:hypothetical protein
MFPDRSILKQKLFESMLKTSAYGRANYQLKNTLSTAYIPIKEKNIEIEIETEENR